MHHDTRLTIRNARRYRQDRPLEVASEHVSDDRLFCDVLAARVFTVLPHLVKLLEDAQDDPALLEERQEHELERFFDVSHEKVQHLTFILPLLI